MSFPFKLGAKKPTFYKHMPSFKDLPSFNLPKAPPRLDRSGINPAPQMFNNDKIGDCTAAGVANAALAFSALNGFYPVIDTASVVNFYSATSGYVPGNPNTDQGADPTAVLTYLARNGFKAPNETLVALFGMISTEDRNALGNVMNIAGVVYGAFAMTLSDQYAVSNGYPLDIASPGDQTPYSWGGHLMDIWSYEGLEDSDRVWLLTWGQIYPTTWRWIESRMVAAYGVLFRQLLDVTGHNQLKQDWGSMITQTKNFISTL